ncbi:MAG: hypothetical protein MH208_16795 [Marinobacter sp.]|nr:hypothetical protein [Marinobacter sp.]
MIRSSSLTSDDGRWQLVVVYRGLIVLSCKAYLSQIETVKNEFDEINVDIIAIFTDPRKSQTVPRR